MRKFLQNYLLNTAEYFKCCIEAMGTLRKWGNVKATLIAVLIAAPSLANAGEAPQVVTAVCAGCHGADGKGVAPMFPHLAGQHSVYLKKQINDFIDGRRKNDMMSPIVTALKPEDVNAVADFYSGQKPVGGNTVDDKLIETGMTFYQDGNSDTGVPGCVGCHMDEGVGNKIYPRLAGQSSMYISQQLANFKSGARTNDNGSLMRSVAAKMTEQEMNAVAEYLASLGK